MIYLDTNVIINSIVDNQKKSISEKIFIDLINSQKLLSSFLLVQEVCYVLSRHNISNSTIEKTAELLIDVSTKQNVETLYTRAIKLAKNVGFNNINDCIHTSIAEAFCTEFITFDKGFKNIIPYTNLKISILD
jgi:predicted nucleic acid-binding protein